MRQFDTIKTAWCVTSDYVIKKGFGFRLKFTDLFESDLSLFTEKSEKGKAQWIKVDTLDLCETEEDAIRRRRDKIQDSIRMYERWVKEYQDKLEKLNELNNAH